VSPGGEAIRDDDELRAGFPEPSANAIAKDIGRLDEMCERLIAASPFVVIGSADEHGHADVSPRGGPPGFVTVLDEGHLAIPDATGNNRLDTLANVIAGGRVGLLFLIPGRDTTLRVNGRAWVSVQTSLLERLQAVGKPPRAAIVVAAEEVYTHCPKAFIRSRLWEPESWPDPAALPSSVEVTRAHLRNPQLSLEAIEAGERESLRHRLA
jgi:hypothetical protein